MVPSTLKLCLKVCQCSKCVYIDRDFFKRLSQVLIFFSSYENAMDLHGMHASTSYAQMPASFGAISQSRSTSKLDTAADDKDIDKPVSKGPYLTTGSPHQGLPNVTSSVRIPNTGSRSGLSASGSHKSFGSMRSNESVEETEEDNISEQLGAKPKFTITTPEKKISKTFEFADFISLSQRSDVDNIGTSLDKKDSDKGDIIEIQDISPIDNACDSKREENSPKLQPEKPQKLTLKRSKFKLSLPKLSELPSIVKKEICKKCAKWHDLGKHKICNGSAKSVVVEEKSTKCSHESDHSEVVWTRRQVDDKSRTKERNHSCENDSGFQESEHSTDEMNDDQPNGHFKQIKADIHNLVDSLVNDALDQNVKVKNDDNGNCGPVTNPDDIKLDNVDDKISLGCVLLDNEVTDDTVNKIGVSSNCVQSHSTDSLKYKIIDNCQCSNPLRTDLNNHRSNNQKDFKKSSGNLVAAAENGGDTSVDFLSKCPFFSGVQTENCNGTIPQRKPQNKGNEIDNRIDVEQSSLKHKGDVWEPNGDCTRKSNSESKISLSVNNCNGTLSHDELKSIPQNRPRIASLGSLYEIHDIKCASRRQIDGENDRLIGRKSVPTVSNFSNSEAIVIFQISDDEDRSQS